jgi:protein ImuB
MESVSSRRYLSVWLRRLATDRITRDLQRPVDRQLDRGPLALTGTVKNARLLTAVNDAAARAGLRVGMSFADACAIQPALHWAEAAPEADERLLLALAGWCERYTPLIGVNRPDGLMFDITGVAHLFGGEMALARDCAKHLSRFGLHTRIGIADTVGAAWAAARYGKIAILPSGQTAAAVASLPLGALRLTEEIRNGLRQLGLKTIGELMTRPRAPLAARFGQELIQRLDQIAGREDESITPLLPVPQLSVEQGFPEPLLRDEDILGVLARLGERLCAMLEQRGQGARQMKAWFFGVDGTVNRLAIGTSRPLRDAGHLHRLFTDKFALAKWDNAFGFDKIRLAVMEAESLAPAQKDLTAGEDGPDFAHLIDRLSARLGESRVQRLMPQDSHVPEHASVAVPAASVKEFGPFSSPPERERSSGVAGSGGGQLMVRRHGPSPKPSGVYARDSFVPPFSREGKTIEQDSLAPARPLRLFKRPEPVETIAEVPEGPPVSFRWRRISHEIASVEGPERIALPWWRDDKDRVLTRDYFRVQTADGARLWLFREGLYSETERPRWFLHGFLP